MARHPCLLFGVFGHCVTSGSALLSPGRAIQRRNAGGRWGGVTIDFGVRSGVSHRQGGARFFDACIKVLMHGHQI